MEYKIGMLAKSKAGHDQNQMYIIWNADEQYVYLVNGKNHTLDRPKKKKRMHVQLVRHIPVMLREKMENATPINNEDIRVAVKQVCAFTAQTVRK